MSKPTYKLEVELDGSGGGWTDISRDMLQDCSWNRGMASSGPLDLIAPSCRFTFKLRNGTNTTAGVEGYYSPWHASRLPGWGTGIRVRWTITWNGTDYDEFIGWIVSIDPLPGAYGERTVQVTALDWMDKASTQTLSTALPTLVLATYEGIFSALVGGVAIAPPNGTSTDHGYLPYSNNYPYVFDTIKRDRPNLYAEFQKLANGERARVFLLGDGTLCSQSWQQRAADPSAASATFTASHIEDMNVVMDRETVITRVRGTVWPRKASASSTLQLFILQNQGNVLEIDPGESIELDCPFTDPTQTAYRVGSDSVLSPVATTDYLFNSASNGTGTNLTSSLGVSFVVHGARGVATLTNNHASTTGFVTLFKVRGRVIDHYAKHTVVAKDTAAISAFGDRVLDVDMPYLSNSRAAKFLVEGWLEDYKVPSPRNPWVSFRAIDDGTRMEAFFLDLTTSGGASFSTRVALTESVTGVAGSLFWINGIEKTLSRGGVLNCKWYLEEVHGQANPLLPWILGTSGLGVDNRLSG